MTQEKEKAQDQRGDLEDKVWESPRPEEGGRAEPCDSVESPEKNGEEAGTEKEATVDLSRKLEEKEQELEEMWQRYLRLAADFENFRRRSHQEREATRQAATGDILRELLPVLDNFERALASLRTLFPDNVVTGIEMIYRQFRTVLTQAGLQPVEAVGQPFDPVYHEAFERVETDEWPDGTVTSEVQKGYLLHGKVLRPALVKVAKNCTTPASQLNPESQLHDHVFEEEDGRDG